MATNVMLPQTYAELERWAQKAAASDFVPKEYRGKPESVLICAQYALEIGLGIIPGLQSIAVINGKPSLYGDGLMALCYASPVCEYIKETPILDDGGNITGYVCQAKRKGQDEKVARFTVADAQKAKLAGKSGPWQEYPQRMLQMRARGFALRDAFPDVLKGLISREEAEDYPVDVSAGTSLPDPSFLQAPQPQVITKEQADAIQKLAEDNEFSFEEFEKFLQWIPATSVKTIHPDQYNRVFNALMGRLSQRNSNGNG